MVTYPRDSLAEEWARHEMDVLARLYSAGANVPYPVAHGNTRLVMQYLGSMTDPAPRLSEVTLSDRQLRRATSQVVETMRALASLGWVHGDLSPYNVLWFDEAAWVIDFPQTTDLFLNPSGFMLLERDVDRVASWVGRSGGHLDPVELMDTLCKDANIW